MKRRNFIKSIIGGVVTAVSGNAIAKSVKPLTYDDLPMLDDGKLYSMGPSHNAPLKNYAINVHKYESVGATPINDITEQIRLRTEQLRNDELAVEHYQSEYGRIDLFPSRALTDDEITRATIAKIDKALGK